MFTLLYANNTIFTTENGHDLRLLLSVENHFTINIEVLSSVLYGWKSLESTVREGLSQRQEA